MDKKSIRKFLEGLIPSCTYVSQEELPQHRNLLYWDGKSKLEHPLPRTAYVWAGPFKTPPRIGERVNVRINDFGQGVVGAYFVQHGFLGLVVEIDELPEWRKKDPSLAKYGKNVCVFGAEVEPPPPTQAEIDVAYRDAAREAGNDVDSGAVVSHGNGPGAYVQAWVWVPESDVDECYRIKKDD